MEKVVVFYQGPGFVPVVFDFATGHVANQRTVTTDKAQMEISSLIPTLMKPRKAVHIQLPLKGCILGLIEKAGTVVTVCELGVKSLPT